MRPTSGRFSFTQFKEVIDLALSFIYASSNGNAN